ncbi:hypothetical protein VPH35_042967 [Triticum aestivum]
MVDIENPPAPNNSSATDAADGGNDAAMAEPSRHSFWAWKERFIIRFRTNDHPDTGEEVAAVDADQLSRHIFVYGGLLVVFVIIAVSVAMLVLVHRQSHSTAGTVVYVVTRILGFSGLVVAVCWGAFFIHLSDAMAQGDKEAEGVVDCLM